MEGVIERFESTTTNSGEAQRETLRRILEENGGTEYLRRFGMEGKTDVESFRSRVPVVTYLDLEPYIHRIANGDSGPVLTSKPITSMSLSSGTTQGKPKFIPFNDFLVKSTIQIYQTSYAFRNREFPMGKGKALQFIYISKPAMTEGGLRATTGTTNLICNDEYIRAMRETQSPSCSPPEVIFASDFRQALYCHLLCGLLFSGDVQVVFSTFARGIVHALRTFELVWQDLISDIRTGVLSPRITIPSVRSAVSKLLKSDPELADAIHAKCIALRGWRGLVPAIWSNAKYIYGIMTGSMDPYSRKLRHYAGDLPLISADYGSSEGWIGANIDPNSDPESAAFVVLPDIGFFEFMPLSPGDSSEPVGLTEVEVGKEYEVVVTNSAGFYRYRLGDVVRVAGFHNASPELKYVCRRSLLLNIGADRNTEKDLQIAVEEAGRVLASEELEIVDFTSTVERSPAIGGGSGRYVVFMELSGEATEGVLRRCCDRLDLAFVDDGYVGSRKSGEIAPLELRVLRRGTFEKILDHFLSLGAAVSQFKTPRCVGLSNTKVLQILCANVQQSYLSDAYSAAGAGAGDQ